MKLENLLNVAIRGGASDIILKPGKRPKFRHNGEIVSLDGDYKVSEEEIASWIIEIMPPETLSEYEKTGDVDFSYNLEDRARFRVNCFKHQDMIGMVMRVIPGHVKTVEELQLPDICYQIAKLKRGLVLVTGATGSGKSTTLAAIIEKINYERPAHIITIEDPIEYKFAEKRATITQREVGKDTHSFAKAIRAALRQNPDVIFLGELRDKETIEAALMAAETGHLVLATLHTSNAPETLTRIMSFFPPDQHSIIKWQLSESLHAVLSQRLVPQKEKDKVLPVIEIMTVNMYIKKQIIESNKFDFIVDAIKNGESYGMISFDKALLHLLEKGSISVDIAEKNASSPEALKLLMAGVTTN